MKKNVFAFALLIVANASNCQGSFDKNPFQKITITVQDVWQQLKDQVNDKTDEITEKKAQELKEDILNHVKQDSHYQKAMCDADALIPWVILKACLPKHAILTAYSHYLAGEENMKFYHWKKAVSLANAELNALHEDAKKGAID